MALLRAAMVLSKLKVDGDEQFGVDIVRRSCEEPIRQIVLNSGTEGAMLFAGFVAFFLSWTKNKNFILRFVQVVAYLFLAWSLASLTATLMR